MAWEHFPVARGQRLTAAMLNELRDAAQERGLTVPAAVAAGDSANAVSGFILSLRQQIETSVQNGWWWWVESWTDPVTWSIWKLSLAETNASAFPPLKNVFEAAFGAGHADWRREGTNPLEAQELNDIYLVLKTLKFIPVTESAVIPLPARERSVGYDYTTCSAALTALDAAPFAGITVSDSTVHYTSVYQRSSLPPFTNYAARQWYSAFVRGFVIPKNASKLYLRWGPWAGRYVFPGGTQGLAREQYGHLLYGQGPPPSDFYDEWGTYYDTIIFASGTAHNFERVEKFDAPPEGDFYFAMYGEPAMSASGAGLCGLGSYTPYSAYEYVRMGDASGSPPYPSLIEMNYTKS